MEQPDRWRPPFMLRRFLGAPIEVRKTGPANSADPNAGLTCRLAAHADGETEVYEVQLAAHHAVTPADWRRFAYDHARIAELLTTCVTDNLALFGFDPQTDESRSRIEATLAVALGDLTSIFESKSVQCEFTDDGFIRVAVSGDHKNGETRSYFVESRFRI